MRTHSARPVVRARRTLARRPWIYWLVTGTAAVACGTVVSTHTKRLDAVRAAWGAERNVVVADRPIEPGDALAEASRISSLPAAVVPSSALETVDDGIVARQSIDAGGVVTAADVATRPGPLALVPEGWRAVAIVESPPSGAAPGDRVDAVSDGFTISAGALVVGNVSDATLVAVPADDAPAVALAGADRSIQLVRAP